MRIRGYARTSDALHRLATLSRVALSGREPTPPLFLNFDLTDGCNIACVMCGSKTKKPRDQHVASLEQLERAGPIFASVVGFQWGCQYEPMLYPHFREATMVVRRFLPKGVRGHMVCNGTLLNERRRADLIEGGIIDRMRISFDGSTKETFEAIRFLAKFDKVLTHVKALAAERAQLPFRMRIEFNFTIQPGNIRELPDVVRLAADLGLDAVTTHKLYPADYGILEPTYHAELRRNIDHAAELASTLGIDFERQVYRSSESEAVAPPHRRMTCGYLEEPVVLVLHPNGKLVSTCQAMTTTLGNLFESDAATVLSSPEFQFMQALFRTRRRSKCLQCHMYREATPSASSV